MAYKRRANLSFGQIFKLNPNTSLLRYLDREIANATFLPHHCQLWEWMHFQRNDYADYMHTYMRSEGPSSSGHFTIGSAYNAGVPAEAFDRAFIGMADDLQRAASTVQGLIALKSGRPKGQYACVHVRTADHHRNVSNATVAWLRGSLDNRLPLYLMSSNSSEELLQAIGPERCATTGCFASQDLLPGGCRGDDYRRLFVELAVCAMAESVHLSTRDETIRRGKPVLPNGTSSDTDPAVLWGSTLQWVMSMVARLPSTQQLRASQEGHLERSGPAVVTESEMGQLMDYLGVSMTDVDPLDNVTEDGLEQGSATFDTFCESKEHQEGAEELFAEDLF